MQSGLEPFVIRGLQAYIEKNYSYDDFWQRFLLYRCTARNLTINSRNEFINSMTGDHKDNLTNYNVNWLEIKESHVSYLPSGFETFFPRISILVISGIYLLELTMEDLTEFPRLKFIWAPNNNLVSLQPDLFSRHLITIMDFSNNKLKYLDKNSLIRPSTDYANFLNNECLDNEVECSPDYPNADKYHKSCLFPNEIFCSYQKIGELYYVATIEEGMEFEGIEKTKIRYSDRRAYELLNVNRVAAKITSKFLNFTRIPKIICQEFIGLEELEITGSLIAKISKYELKNFVKLKTLKMPYNQLHKLTSDTFLFNQNLEIIDLSYNKIKYIGLGTFAELKNLQSLSLNSISCIDGVGNKNDSNFRTFMNKVIQQCGFDDVISCKFSISTFRYIGNAYYCDVVGRKSENPSHFYERFFSSYKKEHFSKLSSLEKFNGVLGNHLNGKSNLDLEVLSVKYEKSRFLNVFLSDYIPNLKSIRIIHSDLRYLFVDTFNGLANLLIVDMSHNLLTEIPKKIFDQNKNLIFVDFSYNNLKRVSIDMFEKSISLKIIRFINNPCTDTKLKDIQPLSLPSVINKCNVQGIELICNEKLELTTVCVVKFIDQMSEIHPVVKIHNVKNFKEIEDFIIDYAAIEYLPINISNFFPYMKQYEAFGMIKEISKQNFENLIRLQRIDLTSNMIEIIESNVFEDNKNLDEIFLNFNRIKFIAPKALKHLNNLYHIELKDNPCANEFLQKVSLDEAQRRLENVNVICGAALPYDFRKVKRTINLHYPERN